MKSIVFRPKADADLDAIWDYTFETWGRDQANAYVLQIRAAIEAVARDQRSSQSAADVMAGYRKVIEGRHVIFFRLAEDAMEVVRILHQRMDVGGKM